MAELADVPGAAVGDDLRGDVADRGKDAAEFPIERRDEGDHGGAAAAEYIVEIGTPSGSSHSGRPRRVLGERRTVKRGNSGEPWGPGEFGVQSLPRQSARCAGGRASPTTQYRRRRRISAFVKMTFLPSIWIGVRVRLHAVPRDAEEPCLRVDGGAPPVGSRSASSRCRRRSSDLPARQARDHHRGGLVSPQAEGNPPVT